MTRFSGAYISVTAEGTAKNLKRIELVAAAKPQQQIGLENTESFITMTEAVKCVDQMIETILNSGR